VYMTHQEIDAPTVPVFSELSQNYEAFKAHITMAPRPSISRPASGNNIEAVIRVSPSINRRHSTRRLAEAQPLIRSETRSLARLTSEFAPVHVRCTAMIRRA
jgi:hypothetical protein